LKFHPKLNLASKCRQVYNVALTTTLYKDFELLARYLGSVMKTTLTTHFDDSATHQNMNFMCDKLGNSEVEVATITHYRRDPLICNAL
jgi:hypothetical protein